MSKLFCAAVHGPAHRSERLLLRTSGRQSRGRWFLHSSDCPLRYGQLPAPYRRFGAPRDDGNAFRISLMMPSIAVTARLAVALAYWVSASKEVAAGFVYAFAVAFHAGGVGCVTLNACDLDALDIGPAGCLCSFNSGLRRPPWLLPCCRCRRSREALVGINAGIVCYDRLVGVCDSGCNSLETTAERSGNRRRTQPQGRSGWC